MKKLYVNFLESLRAQLSQRNMSFRKFLTEKTYINGKLFSFRDHEFQEYICGIVEANIGSTISITKCSQIGLSEIFNRIILSRMAVRPGTSALISFPSKSFSQEVLKTRFAGVIRESPTFRGLINYANDSASVKEFHNGSIMYAVGGSMIAKSSTTLLNRPIDTILIDERDRQDPDIISGYRSRMTHTPPEDRLIINISTPTADSIGIDAEVKESREIHTPWIGCPCGHEFIGDFYTHVVVPGYEEPLVLLTKAKAAKLDLSLAYLECPECKGKLTKENKKTVWRVTHNPEGVRKKIGIVIDPFAAMGFITMPDLVESSTEYTSHVEFMNQGLGKTADRTDSSLSYDSIIFTKKAKAPGIHVFGLDLGKLCHFMHGILQPDMGFVHVVESHIVKLTELETFLLDQHQRFIYAAGVVDSQPYTDIVYRLVKRYPRLFSAIYVSPSTPIPEMYRLKMSDKHNEIVRQVAINKSVVMDSFAGSLKDFYTFETGPLDAHIQKHFLDMRRVRDYRFNEMIYKWVKSSKGEDHFWHTGIYLFMATKMALAGINTSASIPPKVSVINPDKLRAEQGRRR